MVIFDIGLGFGVGCILKRVEKRESMGLTAIAAGMGVAPAGLIFLNLYPDWDLQYLLPKEAVPLWFPGIFCFLIIAASLLGNWLQGKWKNTLLAYAIFYGAYCAWSITRIGVVTSYAQYHAGERPEFPMAFLADLATFAPLTMLVLFLCIRAAMREPTNGQQRE